MNIWSAALILVSSQIVATVAPAAAHPKQSVAAPFGDYQVVAQRKASDVLATADTDAGTGWLGQRVSFGENALTWLGGKTCKLWSARETDSPVITLADPNLSDLAIPPLDSTTSSGDKRVNKSVDLICQDDGERILGSFVIVDARVLVTSTPSGALNLILERPLTGKQVKQFKTQLKDMKFYAGEVNGDLDEATMTGVGFYADYRGAAFRFHRTAITENLLDGLRVLDKRKSDDESMSRPHPPKRSKDDLAESGIAKGANCRVAPFAASGATGVNDGPFTLEREVDGDGIADVVRLKRSSDSGAATTDGALTLSATGEAIEISRYVSLSSMINIHIVPPALAGGNRAAARRLVEDALFGMTCREPDPSLARLLAIDKAVVWRDGKPVMPGNYTVYYPQAPLGLIPFVGAWRELGLDGKQPVAVWVEYLGGTHRPAGDDRETLIPLTGGDFRALAMTPRYRAYGTQHGVVVADIVTEKHAWVYVFKGGHKLRWKSVMDATLDGSIVTTTARYRDADAEQKGTITVDLYDGSYSESWNPPSPDTTAQQRPPE